MAFKVSTLQKSDENITTEIPQHVLENLRCSICENYLSRSPVYLQYDEAVCGRCFSPDRPANRNKLYETLAKVMMFPCKNRDLGCLEKVPFAEESENLNHEEVCPFRQYVCPIMGSTHCEWVGTNKELLKHCEEQHEDRIQDSPFTLTYDISKSEQKNFLLRAFQVLFLLHTKVCVTSGKIYHAVRYLGFSDKAQDFNFNLDIKRKAVKILTNGCVTKQGCLTIQEDTSLVLKINSLLDVLGGFEDTTFTVTMEQLSSAIINCTKCGLLVAALVHRTAEGWWCEKCAPSKLNCYFKSYGCSYKDTTKLKLDKHKWYFCETATYCSFCQKKMPLSSQLEHYNNEHQNKMYHSGSSWQMKWSKATERILLNSVAGIAVCRYSFKNKEINIALFLPVESNRLHEFKCTVHITQTATGRICIFKPEMAYNSNFDWGINITETDFPNWSYDFEVHVDITKTDT